MAQCKKQEYKYNTIKNLEHGRKRVFSTDGKEKKKINDKKGKRKAGMHLFPRPGECFPIPEMKVKFEFFSELSQIWASRNNHGDGEVKPCSGQQQE